MKGDRGFGMFILRVKEIWELCIFLESERSYGRIFVVRKERVGFLFSRFLVCFFFWEGDLFKFLEMF